jgi:predicted nucleic acid-binding protein
VKKRVYFDTSAVIKEFVVEKGSELIDKITNAARNQKLQIVSSAWSINESIAVIDRLSRQKFEETGNPKLSTHEKQEIISTFVERVSESDEKSNFFFAPIAHEIVSKSRVLIDGYHISADDALHVYTAYIFDCTFFLIHDHKTVNRIKKGLENDMKVIDLGEDSDLEYVASELRL